MLYTKNRNATTLWFIPFFKIANNNSKNSMNFEQDIKVARIYELLFNNKDIFRENIQIMN